MMKRILLAGALGAATILAACGERKAAAPSTESAAAAPAAAAPSAAAAGATQTPAPGGKVIVVELITDEKGNYFKPNEIEAHKGDVVRYTLKIGVHNVHFLPDSNPGAVGLPPVASDLLQLPGQTYDVLVNFKPGKYYFQCDPHAALGMRGHLKVED